jgi:HlyD family secretion protein
MTKKKLLTIAIGFICVLLLIAVAKKVLFEEKKPALYSVAKPEQRNIQHILKATGYLEVKDMMKIGSLVPGVIDKMFAEENDVVKTGQLLALIDDGKGDTLVKQAQAQRDAAHAQAAYTKEHFKRLEQLFNAKQISLDAYQKITAEHLAAQATLAQAEGKLEEATLQFNNKKITAPDNGIVIGKIGAEGETVTLSAPPTLIYTIAKNLTHMEAKLEVDETVIGDLMVNARARLSFDTYPNKNFYGTITKISNAPKTVGGAVSYLATIPLENSAGLFRPGMTVNAEINIASKKGSISVPANIFAIKRSMIEDLAKIEKMEYKPLSHEEQEELLKNESSKTIWVKEGNAFVEKPVEIGISDNAFYEIPQGLDGTEDIVVDTIEPDRMAEFFEQFFGKGLTE